MSSAALFKWCTHHTLGLLMVVLVGTALLLSAAAGQAAAEPGGYGPVAPPSNRDIGLSGSVLTASAAGPAGQVLAAMDADMSLRLDVPAGMFESEVRVALHRQVDAAVTDLLAPGEDLVGAWSVTVTSPDGTPLQFPSSWDREGLRLQVTGPGLGLPGQTVRYGRGASSEPSTDALRPGVLDLVLTSSRPGALVVEPATEQASTIAKTTGAAEPPDMAPADPLPTVSLAVLGAAALVTGGTLTARRRKRR